MHRYLTYSCFLFVAVLLSSCASSPSPVLPPTKLTPIKPEISVAEQWYEDIGEGVSDRYHFLEPVFYNGRIYTVDYQGLLSVINEDTGDVLWNVKLDLPVSAGLSRINNMLFAATSDGEVIALDISDGKIIWKKNVSSEVFARPVQAGKYVIVRSVDGKIAALELDTGKIKWVYDRPVPALTLRGSSAPVVYESTIIAGLDNGKLVGISLDTGQESWSLNVTVPRGRTEIERMTDIDASPVIKGEHLYVVTYQGKIANIHITTGKLVWTRKFSAYNGIVYDDSNIYLADSEGYVWALDQKSGATIWKQDKLLRRSLTMPTLYKNTVAVADFNGFVHFLDIDDGHIKGRIHLGGFDSDKETEDDYVFSKSSNILIAPVVSKGSLFVFDRLGHVGRFTISDK